MINLWKNTIKLMAYKQLSRKQFAIDLNISYSYISSLINGDKRANIDIIEKIANYFQLTPSELMSENIDAVIARKESEKNGLRLYQDIPLNQRELDFVREPSVPFLSVRYLPVFNNIPYTIDNWNEQIKRYQIGTHVGVGKGSYMFIVKMPDDSMESIFKKDDLLVIDPEANINNNDIVAVRQNGFYMIRRYYKKANYVLLSPESKSYEPVFSDLSDVKALYRVTMAIQFL